jgi:hypothetical protein
VTRAESGAGGTHDAPCPAGPHCAVCGLDIEHADFEQAMVWADPGGNACCAHVDCLRRLGETELGLAR